MLAIGNEAWLRSLPTAQRKAGRSPPTVESRTAIVVAQGYPMILARPAAVFVAGACGKEAAKDTMLRMEDRQMLIGDHFELTGPDCTRQLRDLGCIEVMRGREPLEAEIKEGPCG